MFKFHFMSRKNNILIFCAAAAVIVFIAILISFLLNKSPDLRDFSFSASVEAMSDALALDISSHSEESGPGYNFAELIAFLAAKYENDFEKYNKADLENITGALAAGKSMSEAAKNLKNYKYYYSGYSAVFSEFVGCYEKETEKGSERGYGLKVFFPLADGFSCSESDDFGAARTYGYDRQHTGHDFMAAVGTPVIAAESGTIEELGWNEYGGWRIGIRSFDQKRYYYYAHLRKDFPFSSEIKKGGRVCAGDVIGYVGKTGYSKEENAENIGPAHLHFGVQLIFDEKEKNGENQTWINLNELSKLLYTNRAQVEKISGTKEYKSKYEFIELSNFAAESAAFGVAEKEAEKSALVPIIMYHRILSSGSTDPTYTVTPEQFENDLKYLHENGYHTIIMADLVNYVYSGAPLPEKPIILSFDDGHYNNYFYGSPLLEKYDMRAVISVVGEYSERSEKEGGENPNFSYLSFETMRKMIVEGHFEIQNHSYHLHKVINGQNGAKKKHGESTADYSVRLTKDLMKLQTKIYDSTGRLPTTFTFPFGAYSGETNDILKDIGFKASLSCRKGVSTISRGNPESLFGLFRILRSPKKSAEDFFSSVEKMTKDSEINVFLETACE